MRSLKLRLTGSIVPLSGLVAFAVAPAALGQEACGEQTCPDGFDCQTIETPCAVPCYVTEEGEVICEESECESEPYAYCARAACETDADCGDAMVCHTFEQQECWISANPVCPPGETCAAPEPTEQGCTTTEYSQCTYSHELPCETDAECGEGFSCVESVSCWCSGSGSDGPPTPDRPTTEPGTSAGAPTPPDDPAATPASADGGVADSDPAPPDGAEELPAPPIDEGDGECGCAPSGVNHCEMQTIDCATDADCPAGWSCLEGPTACWEDSEGNSGCETATSQCYFPGGSPGGGGWGDSGGSVGENPSGQPGDPGEPAPEVPGPTDPNGGDSAGGPTSGNDGNSNEEGVDDDAPRGGHGGAWHPRPKPRQFVPWLGCSVDNALGGTSSRAPWALSLLALGAALLRRRQR